MRRSNIFKRNTLALGITSALALSVSAGLHAEESEKYKINIASQNIGQAIRELARGAGVQIIMPSQLGVALQTPQLNGEYSLSQALDLLVEGSGLAYEFLSEKSVVIKAVADEDGSDSDVDEEIIVTGSLLRNVEPTSQTKIYTSEDIARLGVSSAEDLLRKLPQNYGGHNNLVSTDQNFNRGGSFDGLNTASANLRGLGNDSTLVLVNGRRTAASAQFEGGVVNLTTIPASSIERVEIVLDGASALYGSDAIAGVINFILKKDYSGSETAVRYEDSINGGDKYRLTQTFGFGWGSGNATVDLLYEDSKPTDSSKLGVRSNYFDRGGVRNFALAGGQPGLVRGTRLGTCEEVLMSFGITDPGFIAFSCSNPAGPFFNGGPVRVNLGSLPSSFDGTESWTIDDLSPNNVTPSTLVRLDQGSFVESKSVSLRLTQQVGDNVELFADLLYSTNDAEAGPGIPQYTAFSPNVPASNPFNPLGQDLSVTYIPETELLSGQIPFNASTSKQEQINATIGFTAELPWETWQIRGSVSHSADSSENMQIEPAINSAILGFNTAQQLIADIRAGDGDFSRALANPAAVYLLLQEGIEDIDGDGSPDAYNFFGNGTAQTPLLRHTFGPLFVTNPDSVSQTLELGADGVVGSWAAGDINLGVGGEYRREYRDYGSDSIRGERLGALRDVTEPERSVTALFGELNLPIVSGKNALPGVQELTVNIGARWEEYAIDDSFAVSGVDDNNIPIIEPTSDATFTHTSPRIGISWQVVDSFRIRASWGESFRAPNFFQLLGDTSGSAFSFPVNDPVNNETVNIPSLFVANPNLEAETSKSSSVGFEWTPEFVNGLSVEATWNRIVWDNRIGQRPFEDQLRNPEIGIRNAEGDLIRVEQKVINLNSFTSESVDIDVSYVWDNDFGNFRTSLNASYIGTLEEEFEAGEVVVNVGTLNGPSDWRGRAMLQWDLDGMGANLIWNYTGSFQQNDFNPNTFEDISRYVSDYKTWDLTGFYQMDDWRFEVGVINLTNTRAPFVDLPYGFDPSRVDPRGRLIYAEVKKSFEL